MALKHRKSCLTSLMIREGKIKLHQDTICLRLGKDAKPEDTQLEVRMIKASSRVPVGM